LICVLSFYLLLSKAAFTLRADWGVSEDKLSLKDLLASPHILIGSQDELVEKLLRLREVYGFTYFVFWEPLETGARLIKRLKTRLRKIRRLPAQTLFGKSTNNPL
jgi:hypothetical protein